MSSQSTLTLAVVGIVLLYTVYSYLSSLFFTLLFIAVPLGGAYVYFLGIPPQLKNKLQRKTMTTLGESSASDFLQDQIGKVPASDQQGVQDLREGLGNAFESAMQGKVGEGVGDFVGGLGKRFGGGR